MGYSVTINTTNGCIQEHIDDMVELEALLIKYYDVYTGVNVQNDKVKRLGGKDERFQNKQR